MDESLVLIPRLVDLLSTTTDPKLQFELCWCLTNFASGNKTQTAAVAASGAVSALIHMLQSPSQDVQVQALWALGNITGDGPQCRDLVIDHGVIPPLVQLLNSKETSSEFVFHSAWVISNLCRGKKPSADFSKVKVFIPVLSRFLSARDANILADACWAFSYLLDGPSEQIQTVIEHGVCRRLVELLMHQDRAVVKAALRAVGNIVTGDHVQTQVVVNSGALYCLKHLMESNDQYEHIRREACWAVSNVCAGTSSQIQAVIDAKLVPSLLKVLEQAEFSTRKEATWAVCNIVSGGVDEHIAYLAGLGIIRPLCDLLTVQDAQVVLNILRSLQRILQTGMKNEAAGDGRSVYADAVEECHGLDKIEYLQQHQDHDIYEVAFDIITTFFGGETDPPPAAFPTCGPKVHEFIVPTTNNQAPFSF